MTEINIFENAEFGKIRVTMNGDEPMFCLADVCKVLGLTQPSKVKERLNEKGVNTIPTLTPGGTQELLYINESNLYKTIFQSRKESAERFTDWVTSEVLPTIRKTGSYSVQTVLPDFTNPAEAARAWAAEYEAKQQALLENEKLQLENTEMKPKAEYHDKVLDTESCYTTTQIAKELEMSGRQLNILLKNMGVQYKQSGQWLLTKEYQDKGYVKTRTHIIDHERTKHTTVWTEKGREFLIDLAEDF